MNAPSFEASKASRNARIRFQARKIAVLLVLFVVLFSASYYVVNLLDLSPAPKVALLQPASTTDLTSGDEQLQKAVGSTNVSMAGFVAWAKANNLAGSDIYNADPDHDGLPNYLEYIYGTDPNNPDTDGDGFSDKQEIINGYDPDSKGDAMTIVSVKIDKIGVDAPMVWSKTDVEADMLSDLQNGLSHFVKTAAPGQDGNMIISGHSSNYVWAKGNYNHVFKDLNNLQSGDIVTINTLQKNGRMIAYQYKVDDKFVTTPDDDRIFDDTPNPTLTLSTCWPIGTNLKRLIIKAQLVQ